MMVSLNFEGTGAGPTPGGHLLSWPWPLAPLF